MTYKKKHKLFMGIYALLLFLITILAFNCSHITKKDADRQTVIFPEPVYEMTPETLPFRFAISDQATFKSRETKPGEYFCDVIYPALHAQVYCTWHAMTPDKLPIMLEESRRMAFQHTAVATAIREERFANDFTRVFATVYNIDGESVATPIQLGLTDSVSYFFNASLYIHPLPAQDSVAPLLDYLRNDLLYLINSFTPVKNR